MFRSLFVVILVLTAALQASGLADSALAEAAVPLGPGVSSGFNAIAQDASLPEKITPNALVKVEEPVTSATIPNSVDFQEPVSTRNPWLYIIIGFLLVTGVMLYVDPKLF